MYNSMYYNGFYPYQAMSSGIAKKGLFASIGKINWGNLLSNTQKTLNVINQAIPVYYQVKPIYNNAKTMFKVMGAFKDNGNTNSVNTSNNSNYQSNIEEEKKDISTNRPIFFS